MRSRGANPFSGVLVVAAAVLAGYFVTACRPAQPTVDYSARYSLEVVNGASERVRVEISMNIGRFRFPSAFWQWFRTSGIVVLESSEKRTFEMEAGLGTAGMSENSKYVRYFRWIAFYDANSDTPYRSYSYPQFRCDNVDHRTCWDSGNDKLFLYESSDGTLERLFVESPDRPFYLERDKQDPDLGRLVITFVPSADAGSRDAVE